MRWLGWKHGRCAGNVHVGLVRSVLQIKSVYRLPDHTSHAFFREGAESLLCRPQLCRVEGSEERYLAFFNTCTVHMLFMAAVPVLCAVSMWRQAEEAQISISFAYKGGVSRIIVPRFLPGC